MCSIHLFHQDQTRDGSFCADVFRNSIAHSLQSPCAPKCMINFEFAAPRLLYKAGFAHLNRKLLSSPIPQVRTVSPFTNFPLGCCFTSLCCLLIKQSEVRALLSYDDGRATVLRHNLISASVFRCSPRWQHGAQSDDGHILDSRVTESYCVETFRAKSQFNFKCRVIQSSRQMLIINSTIIHIIITLLQARRE